MASMFSAAASFLGDSSAFDAAAFDAETASRIFDRAAIAKECTAAEERVAELAKNKDELLKLIGYIDLTTLAGDDTKARVQTLVDRAVAPIPTNPSVTCAAVCVYPARVADVKARMDTHAKKLGIASVAAGFPSGQYRLESRVLEVELAVADGASEIDIVISRAAALEGDWETVYNEVLALKKAAGPAHLKTIIATGELKTLDNVYKASWASLLAQSDFIKTSTGKESTNATPEVSYVMCSALKRWHEQTGNRCGFKPAGGIRTVAEALHYVAIVERVLGTEWLTPELFRIGASSLLDEILKAL